MSQSQSIVRRASVAIEPEQYTRAKIDLIRQTLMPKASDVELELFVTYAQRTGLDAFRKQIYAIPVWNEDAKRYVYQFCVGIDGLRLVAVRTGEFEGQEGPHWKAKGGEWVDVWEDDGPPFACRVGVYRSGSRGAIWGLCRYDSFVRRNRKGQAMGMWASAPDHMLSIRAESHALRKAFPAETAGLQVRYDEDEPVRVVNPDSPITYPQLGKLHRLAKELDFSKEERLEAAGVTTFKELTKGQAHELITAWQELLKSQGSASGDTRAIGQVSGEPLGPQVPETEHAPDAPLKSSEADPSDASVGVGEPLPPSVDASAPTTPTEEPPDGLSDEPSPSYIPGVDGPAEVEGETNGGLGGDDPSPPRSDSPPEPTDDPKVTGGPYDGYRFKALATKEAGRAWLEDHEMQTGPAYRRQLAEAWLAWGATQGKG